MKIKDLLDPEDIVEEFGSPGEVSVGRICVDTRRLRPGSVFFAVDGCGANGHQYLAEAARRGAESLVFEDASFGANIEKFVPRVRVRNSRLALTKALKRLWEDPFSSLETVGVTGTNGKTTVTYLIRSIIQESGFLCALIGTTGARIAQNILSLSNTTPGPVDLYELGRFAVDEGCKFFVTEISSHALSQCRIEGLNFKTAVFTNLTQDHLDYHSSMEDYFQAKKLLFTSFLNARGRSVINVDDPFGVRLSGELDSEVLSFGLSEQALVKATQVVYGSDGTRFLAQTPQGEIDISTPLVGRHNVSNILAAISTALILNFELPQIKHGIECCASVPGRLERLNSSKGFSIFVDYAHTDDALKNVLESLRLINHNGRIIMVFGCGGDRDKGKRPLMGSVAAGLSDFCIVTSDNPRSEDPEKIIDDIVAGFGSSRSWERQVDRRSAIRRAIQLAEPGDFVLIAGKGHETYQLLGKEKIFFDDSVIARECMEESRSRV